MLTQAINETSVVFFIAVVSAVEHYSERMQGRGKVNAVALRCDKYVAGKSTGSWSPFVFHGQDL